MKIKIYPIIGNPIVTNNKFITTPDELIKAIDACALVFAMSDGQAVAEIQINQTILYVEDGNIKEKSKALYLKEASKE